MAARVLFAGLTRYRANFAAGAGYIAGEPPGLVTVNGVPAAREIELRHRAARVVIATTFSAADGTYRIDGVDPAQEFGIIGRDWAGIYNDTITARVRPEPYAIQSMTGSFVANNSARTLGSAVDIFGGERHVVSVVAGTAPPGISFAVAAGGAPTFDRVGRWLTASGTTVAGTYAWTLRVTAADRSSMDLACTATFT